MATLPIALHTTCHLIRHGHIKFKTQSLHVRAEQIWAFVHTCCSGMQVLVLPMMSGGIGSLHIHLVSWHLVKHNEVVQVNSPHR